MLTNYRDIIALAGEPKWYDEHGVPRYSEFHPNECGVYIKAVALLEIECQDCEKHFLVATVPGDGLLDQWRDQAIIHHNNLAQWISLNTDTRSITIKDLKDILSSLTPNQEKRLDHTKNRPHGHDSGWVGWGDPPAHGCVGDTMGAWEVRVVQYWEKGRDDEKYRIKLSESSYRYDADKMKADGYIPWTWVRYPEHEIEIDEKGARTSGERYEDD